MPSFEKPPDGSPSITDRLRAAREALATADASAREQKTSRSRSRKKDAEEIAVVARVREQQYQALGGASAGWNELKDVPFEPLFRALAVELQKDGHLPDGFEAKLKELKDIKKELGLYEAAPPALRQDPAVREAYETIRTDAVELMREWARTLSGWFAEHAGLREQESVTASEEIEALLADPLFNADFRVEDESFDQVQRRAVAEFGESAFDRTQQSLRSEYTARKKQDFSREKKPLNMASYSEDASKKWIPELFHLSYFVTDAEKLITAEKLRKLSSELQQLPLNGGLVNYEMMQNVVRSYFPNIYIIGEHRTRVDSGDFEYIIDKLAEISADLDTISRTAEVERLYAEERMRAAIEIIDRQFTKEDEKKNALAFITSADKQRQAWAQGIHGDSVWVRHYDTGFPTGAYHTSESPPEWLMRVYKELNNAHLMQALIVGNAGAIQSRFGEDQVLRMFFHENAYNKKDITPDQYKVICTRSNTPSDEWVTLDVQRQTDDVKIDTHDMRHPRFKFIPSLTLDPKVIALADSVSVDLEKRIFSDERNDIAQTLRAWFGYCDTGVMRFKKGYNERLEQTDVELRRYVAHWRDEVDRHLQAKKPTSRERLAALARTDGAITITSAADGVAAVDALRGLVERYLYVERTALKEKIDHSEHRAGNQVREAEVRVAAEVSARTVAEQRHGEIQRRHQDLFKHVETLTGKLLTEQGLTADLRTKLDSVETGEKIRKANTVSALRAALLHADQVQKSMFGGDAQKYAVLKKRVEDLIQKFGE